MYLLYNLLSWPLAVLLFPWLAYRAARGRLPGLGQRLGLIPLPNAESSGPTLWLHAVSLGEVKAAAPLIEQLQTRFPKARVVMTTSTRTGWEAARKILPADAVFFPPLDLAWICRRFLHRIRPQAVLVMETELWPNLFREAKRFGAALLLVNGRTSDRAFLRYHATRFFWRRVMAQPDAVLAQSKRDAERFIALGAAPEKVKVAGNLKFALRPSPAPIVQALRAMAEDSAADPILVAGSTMPGEEKLLLEAFQQLVSEFPRLWMILASRHPERFDSVAEEVRALGIPLQLRSQLRPQTKLQLPGVLLLDTMGELGSLYELATVAFVGGTLSPTGGHNILEPAYFARPILIGPSMTNFQEIAEEFLRDAKQGEIPEAEGIRVGANPSRDRQGAVTCEIPGLENTRIGAIVQLADAQGLVPALRFLFRNPGVRHRLGEAARTLLQKKLGATDRIVEEMERLVSPRLASTRPAGAAQRRALEHQSEHQSQTIREHDRSEPSAASMAASGAATLWNGAAALRVWLYQRGLLRQRSLRARVISVGNLAWGGTGKTPFTIWLARRLQAGGLRVSILTRGYGRTSRERVRIIPPGTPPEDAADAGDEVQLYLRNLRVPVGVSSSRYEAGTLLERQFPVDVHLLDDGFQHLALRRDLNMVLIDAENPWGRRPPFPRLLREGPSALGRADAIVMTRCELLPPASRDDSLENLRAALQRFSPSAPCFSIRTQIIHFMEWRSSRSLATEQFLSRCPLAFCGLGNPHAFFRTLEKAGIPAMARKVFPDHHRYTGSDLRSLEAAAAQARADCLLTTEKDLVNLPATANLGVPLYWVAIEPVVEEESRLLQWIWEQLDLAGAPPLEPAGSLQGQLAAESRLR